MKTIEIPLSKKKILLLLLGSLLFVFIGIDFIRNTATYVSWRASKEAIFIFGILGVFFFGTCAVFLLRKLFSRQVGLILHAEGFIDNSSGINAGEILWCDVNAVADYNVMNQSFVIIYLKDPEKYISAQNNIIKRKLIILNYKMSGSPIHITANGLKVSYDKLYNLMQEYFEYYKKA